MKRILSIIPLIVFILIGQIANAQWTSIYTDSTSDDDTELYVANGVLFMKTKEGIYYRTYRSADEGTTWQDISSNFPEGGTSSLNDRVSSIVGVGNEIFATTTDKRLYASTDGGITFTPRYTFTTSYTIRALTTDNKTLYANHSARSIYKSTDNGKTFQEITINYQNIANIGITGFAAIGQNYVLQSNQAGGVIGSSDGGATWTKIEEPSVSAPVLKIFKAKNIIWGSTYNGLVKYNPETKKWTSSLEGVFAPAWSISSNSNQLLCTTVSFVDGKRRHYVSSNDGNSWTELNQDGMLPDNGVNGAQRINEISEKNYFVVYYKLSSGKQKTIVYRWPLTATSVNEQLAKKGFALKPNYPNPFHDQTTIGWTMKTTAQVTIRIYDINGKEMETLVSGKYLPGEYTKSLNTAGRYKPGIYFCQMQAGNHIVTSKLVVQ
ncbi:MAG: T9SS type A sorting domain-containing protein [Bacteroidetes bacterium]|nr:T9SS type A sorting domain-containing protein [Bacteroidota bacterium]